MPSSVQSSPKPEEDWSFVAGFVYEAPLRAGEKEHLSYRMSVRVPQFRTDFYSNPQRLLMMPFGAVQRSREQRRIVFPILCGEARADDPVIEAVLSWSLQMSMLLSACLEGAVDIDRDSITKIAIALKPYERLGYLAAKYARRLLLSIAHRVDYPCRVMEPQRHKINTDWTQITLEDIVVWKQNSSVFASFHKELGGMCQDEFRVLYKFCDWTYSSVRARMIRTASETDAILVSASLDTPCEGTP